MIGPHLKATSGISNVVNNWKEVGIGNDIRLQYISTLTNYVPGRYVNKVVDAVVASYQLFFTKSSNIDLVHIHLSHGMSFYRKLILYKIAKHKKNKVIIHLHGSEFELFFNTSNERRKKIIIKFFNEVDAIIVLSKSWENFIRNISTNNNIFVLYNGVNLQKFSGKIINKDRINISFMGRLGIRKGVYDLLEAFEQVVNKVPSAHLILGGDGDIEEVTKIISEKKLSNNIHLLGWVSGPDKVKVFRECDIYTLPSYSEGLPGSILEAMGVGVPIVTTPVGGIPEAVQENRNGFLVQPGDIESLSDRLLRLCNDSSLCRQMGEESRILAHNKFNIEQIVFELLDIYQKVLSQ
jgi:glycosyltransferase involved in cell wall biosynthesis